MATIRKRLSSDGKARYHVQIRIKGAKPRTATFRRISEARRWAEQAESEIRLGRYSAFEMAEKFTLAQAIDRYESEVMSRKKPSTQESQNLLLRWWKREIGALSLASITSSVLTECRNKLAVESGRHGKRRSPASLNRYVSTLSHVFTIAIREWQWAAENPCASLKKLREPNGRERYLSREEIERLLSACRDSSLRELYPIVVLALGTGMRRGEVLTLEWKQVDLSSGNIRLVDTKNGHRRTVPLTGFVLNTIKQWRDSAESKRLLFPVDGRESKPVTIRRAWVRSLSEAGIDNFRFHDLRHTCASYLVGNGVSLPALAEILGHRTLQMVRRYSHLSDVQARVELDKVSERLFGKHDI